MYLLLIFRNTFRNELGVARLHGGFCVDVGLYLDAVTRAALKANDDRVFSGTPAESYVAAALSGMLLYFGVHVPSNTYNFCSYHIKIESCWHFLKMAATMLFFLPHYDMILIKAFVTVQTAAGKV